MRLLAAREHSTLELRQKLAKKGADDSILDTLLEQLQQDRYISDQRFAEVFVRQKAAAGKGPFVISQLLSAKGISRADTELAMEEAQCDWFELASAVYFKKFKGPITDQKDRAKRMRFLMSRGFGGDIISSVMEASWDE